MSTISGAFDETILLNQMVKAEELMLDNRIKLQFDPNISVLKAIDAANTATVNPLFGRKDRDVSIMWMNACDIAAGDVTSCTFGGNTTSTNTQDLSLSYSKEVLFYVDEPDFDDNYYNVEEAVAKAFLKADVELAEAFAALGVARLNTFKGVNVTAPEGKGDISGSDTYIMPSYWNPSLMAYLHRVAVMNKFNNPILASGNNMYEASHLIAANQGNWNGKGDAVLIGQMPWYFDLFNIDTINTPDYVTYMINMGAVAMASKTYNPDTPEVVNGVFTRYTMNSRFHPLLKYDVYYKPECSGENRVKHSYKVVFHGDIFLNPAGCDANNTGILTFVCGSAS